MRTSNISRKTGETDIKISLNIDGTGTYSVNTGCGFLNHMLELFARHGRFDLTVECKGDTHVDYHHTAEDIAIVLGSSFNEALSDRRGITRYGSMLLPMDEALVLCSMDISGRAYLNFYVDFPTQRIGDFDSELVKEFMHAFTRKLEATIHFKMFYGENSHHIAEAVFKSFARALSRAVAIDQNNPNEIPSTKGVI